MPVDQSIVGRTFPATAPHEVTEDRLRDFAEAVGAAYDGSAAPPTYPIVLAFEAMNAFLAAEQVELFRIVHGEQRFAYERPIVAGDVLTATLTVASLRQIAGNDIIGTSSEVTDSSGALVCSTSATLVHRGPESSERGSARDEGLHGHARRPGALRRGERGPQPDPPG